MPTAPGNIICPVTLPITSPTISDVESPISKASLIYLFADDKPGIFSSIQGEATCEYHWLVIVSAVSEPALEAPLGIPLANPLTTLPAPSTMSPPRSTAFSKNVDGIAILELLPSQVCSCSTPEDLILFECSILLYTSISSFIIATSDWLEFFVVVRCKH